VASRVGQNGASAGSAGAECRMFLWGLQAVPWHAAVGAKGGEEGEGSDVMENIPLTPLGTLRLPAGGSILAQKEGKKVSVRGRRKRCRGGGIRLLKSKCARCLSERGAEEGGGKKPSVKRAVRGQGGTYQMDGIMCRPCTVFHLEQAHRRKESRLPVREVQNERTLGGGRRRICAEQEGGGKDQRMVAFNRGIGIILHNWCSIAGPARKRSGKENSEKKGAKGRKSKATVLEERGDTTTTEDGKDRSGKHVYELLLRPGAGYVRLREKGRGGLFEESERKEKGKKGMIERREEKSNILGNENATSPNAHTQNHVLTRKFGRRKEDSRAQKGKLTRGGKAHARTLIPAHRIAGGGAKTAEKEWLKRRREEPARKNTAEH